jgi:calcineurin-like phosphoesterase family protein
MEMDNHMINRWNTQVKPEDTVWALGDIFFCQADRAKTIMERLNGHKHLVYGNHDQVIRGDKVLQGMFDSIHEYKEIHVDGNMLCLFHYPIYEWNKIHHNAIHLHGHIHERLSGVPGKILNVCVDSPTFGDGSYSLYHSDIVLAAARKLPERPHGSAGKTQ